MQAEKDEARKSLLLLYWAEMKKIVYELDIRGAENHLPVIKRVKK